MAGAFAQMSLTTHCVHRSGLHVDKIMLNGLAVYHAAITPEPNCVCLRNMAKSQKTVVIQHLFDQRFDPKTKTLSSSLITSADVQAAKKYCNEHLGTKINLDSNPFNFMKDIVRGKSADKIWPQRVKELGYVGEQVTGNGNIFAFVPYVPEAYGFTTNFAPTDATPQFPVQSLSLPLAAKELGRKDESWLLQVAVNLRILETHFAVGDQRQLNALELCHLQMDIKLRRVQIDALFLAKCDASDAAPAGNCLITVEAKQGNQRILLEQIARQVKAAFECTDTEVVVPTAIAAISGKGVYLVEFKAVRRAQAADFTQPVFHRDAMYALCPRVNGI